MPARALPLVLCVACLPASAFADQTVTGSATYLERIALPDDATLIVEARGFDGRLLAGVRQPLEGAQVPLPFELALPDGMPATIHAGVAIGGAIEWASARVAVSASDGPTDLGDIRLRRHLPVIYAHAYRCGDRLIEVSFGDGFAMMSIGTLHVTMDAVPVASGFGYAASGDIETSILGKGDTARLTVGEMTDDCTLAPPAGPEAWRARGNEPFWALDAVDGALTLTRPGMTPVGGPRTATVLLADGRFQMAAPEADLTAILSPTICRDTMSGMVFPHVVSLRFDGEELHGCGGRPEDLLTGHMWQLKAIDGADLVADAPATIGFEESGQVTGTGGCNRFSASYTLTGESLTVAPAASTMMACADPVMRQEQAFFDALEKVVRFDVAEDTGALILMDVDGPVMTLSAGAPD